MCWGEGGRWWRVVVGKVAGPGFRGRGWVVVLGSGRLVGLSGLG